MLVDITAVVASERKLQEKDHMYRTLLKSSKQGVLIHQNFKTFDGHNQAWVEMQGAKSIGASPCYEFGHLYYSTRQSYQRSKA
ncbi:hypothetical protein OH492_26630 [Vibrio chagasii]|nr:hypothetical protein [Vibrio chagasii]